MPRSNRPRRGGRPRPLPRPDPLDAGRALSGVPRRETHTDRDWFVRAVAGAAASKSYRCPGCDHEIPAGMPHLVVWAADHVLGEAGAIGERRHWHRPCWSARSRRGPRR